MTSWLKKIIGLIILMLVLGILALYWQTPTDTNRYSHPDLWFTFEQPTGYTIREEVISRQKSSDGSAQFDISLVDPQSAHLIRFSNYDEGFGDWTTQKGSETKFSTPDSISISRSILVNGDNKLLFATVLNSDGTQGVRVTASPESTEVFNELLVSLRHTVR